MKLKRLLLAALIYALPTAAFAQCAGIQPAGSVCGNPSGAGTIAAPTRTPVLGLPGSVLGSLGLAGNTSGTVTITPQAVAGTYNFNLPTAAGSAGQPMLSGGGVAAPMTFGTLSVAGGGTGATTAATARTGLGLGTIATQNSNAVAITGGTITGMSAPSGSSDVATKGYVDSVSSGLIIYPAMTLATAAVLPNTPTYSNGASGVGATLTAGSNTTLTVDATAAPLNTLVLVKNQASAFQNGFYYVSTAGSGAAAWVLTRCTLAACGKEFDTAATMLAGSYATVTSGAANINTAWVLGATVTTVGTTAATFNLFSNIGVSTLNSLNGAVNIVAGTGISVTPAGSNITVANTLPGRQILSAATNFYLRIDGNDTACTGLSNAAYVSGSFPQACAFLTPQGAYNYLYKTYDYVGTGNALVNVGNGTYNCAVNCLLVLGPGPVGTPTGAATAITFIGDVSTPSNVAFSANQAVLVASWNGQISISGIRMISATAHCAYASAHGRINFTNFVDFNACPVAHNQANMNGVIVFNTGYFVTGNSPAHLYASMQGSIEQNAGTVTSPGVPSIATFATSTNGGGIISSVNFSFSAIGTRYLVDFGAIDTTGSGSPGANHFPGNVAGATSVFGGKYNFLLKRDLIPAANDNTPLFLNLAA